MIDGDATECHITATKEAQFEVSFAICGSSSIWLMERRDKLASSGTDLLDCRVNDSDSLCATTSG